MATASDFGFDHDVKFSAPEMIEHMNQLGLQVVKPWTKPRMLPVIEKHHALQRESSGTNSKKYLAEGFDPTARAVTKAQLRQIFSQYDIPYPPGQKADKPTLVRLFHANLTRLRVLNGCPSVASPSSRSSSSRRSTSFGSGSPSPSSRTSASIRSRASTVAVLAPERLVKRIEVTFVEAIESTQAGDHWRTVKIMERLWEKCVQTAEAEDERVIEEEDEEDEKDEEDDTRSIASVSVSVLGLDES
ncbi:hypothetical protein KCU71_g2702, partial [Aureobasidium melanogenum]